MLPETHLTLQILLQSSHCKNICEVKLFGYLVTLAAQLLLISTVIIIIDSLIYERVHFRLHKKIRVYLSIFIMKLLAWSPLWLETLYMCLCVSGNISFAHILDVPRHHRNSPGGDHLADCCYIMTFLLHTHCMCETRLGRPSCSHGYVRK